MADWERIPPGVLLPAGIGLLLRWSPNVPRDSARAASLGVLAEIKGEYCTADVVSFSGVTKMPVTNSIASEILAHGARGVSAWSGGAFYWVDTAGAMANQILGATNPATLARGSATLAGAAAREVASIAGQTARAAGEGFVGGAMNDPDGGRGGTSWGLYIVLGIIAMIVLVVLLVVGSRAIKRI